MSTKVKRHQARQCLVYRHIWRTTQTASPYMAYAILDDETSWLTEDLRVKEGRSGSEVDIGEVRVIIRFRLGC
jgi:hypothetical protein